jgi:hypothetical protein
VSFHHPVQAVEGGGFVALGESGVVENGVDEIVDGAVESEDSLADVKEFGGAFTDDVDAEEMLGVGIEKDFEATGGVAANLSASDFAKIGHAHFVGNALVGELLLGFADEGNFGDGVNAVGIIGAVGIDGHAECFGGGDAALFHGDGTEAGEADDVADGEDVGLLGAIFVVDVNAAALVGIESSGGEIEFVDIALTPDGIEEGFAGDFLFAFEIGDDEMVGSFLHAFNFFIEAKSDAAIAEVIAQGFHHFRVGEFEEARALFDESDADTEGREHAGVFDADDPTTDHDHGFGNLRDAEDLVAVDDSAAVERDERRLGGLGAGGDDDVVGFVFGLAARAFDLHPVRIEKTGGAGNDVDAIAGELGLDDVDFSFDDVGGAEGKIGHADVFLHAVVGAIDALVLVAGEVQNGFANGFTGDGAGVDGDTADDFEALDQSGAFAELGGLNGCALTGGTRTDDDEIVLFHDGGREYNTVR